VKNQSSKSETQNYLFDKIVIACGAFSKRLTDNLDERIPLDTERGLSCSF
jgi:D-amino-acid dehydrogenase